MPIQRSQSAPQPIEALFNVTPLTKSKATRAPEKEIAVVRVKLMRSKSYAVDHSSSSSSASNPWAAREDPFSLGGFFSDRVALDEQKQWGWIHGDEDSEEIDFTRPALDAEESLERLGDEQAEKAISAEDKYGLLSLGKCLLNLCRRSSTYIVAKARYLPVSQRTPTIACFHPTRRGKL